MVFLQQVWWFVGTVTNRLDLQPNSGAFSVQNPEEVKMRKSDLIAHSGQQEKLNTYVLRIFEYVAIVKKRAFITQSYLINFK